MNFSFWNLTAICPDEKSARQMMDALGRLPGQMDRVSHMCMNAVFRFSRTNEPVVSGWRVTCNGRCREDLELSGMLAYLKKLSFVLCLGDIDVRSRTYSGGFLPWTARSETLSLRYLSESIRHETGHA